MTKIKEEMISRIGKILVLLLIVSSIVYYKASYRNGDTTYMKPFLSVLPHHLFSNFTGLLVSIPLPRVFRKPLFDWYINRYGVALEDIAEDPYSFPNLGEFFIRNLKPGIRPIESEVVSPVDGTLRSFGEISQGVALEVKGQQYSIQELLGDGELAKNFLDGYFFNFYLAPGDYHQVHVPVAGEVSHLTYVPGRLWPVNTWAWQNIPQLLVQNERVSAIFETTFGRVAVVMVGALNVGSISMVVPELSQLRNNREIKTVGTKPISLKAGDRLGAFHMGSSVVVLFEKKLVPSKLVQFEQKIKMGNTLIP